MRQPVNTSPAAKAARARAARYRERQRQKGIVRVALMVPEWAVEEIQQIARHMRENPEFWQACGPAVLRLMGEHRTWPEVAAAFGQELDAIAAEARADR
jgi:hypothetical protein